MEDQIHLMICLQIDIEGTLMIQVVDLEEDLGVMKECLGH